jgi:hypothetical protein
MATREQVDEYEAKQRILFEILGRFTHAYAITEGFIHVAFRKISKIPDDVARAITGGQRVKDIIPALKLVAKIHKYPSADISEIEAIFSQFNIISRLRDKIVHRGAQPFGDEFRVSNLFTIKKAEDFELLRFNGEHVKNAIADLGRIMMRVTIVSSPERLTFDAAQRKAIYGAWLYKPPEPRTPNRKSRKAPRRRERPSEPSQA